jgi:hypothetical protein
MQLHDFHESRDFNLTGRTVDKRTESMALTHGYTVNKQPLQRDQRVKDTLVPSRRLMSLVNNDETFKMAQWHLGLFPQKAYTMIQEVGLERVKRVTDFILSIALETPSFFYVDRSGQYNASPEAVRERARKMLITIALNPSRPILEKYAGQHYWERWPKKIYKNGEQN